jgi:transcriptional regulator with XRE-family HTH domain
MNNQAVNHKQSSSLGSLLRFWRNQRKVSQLQLAMDTGISTRHLSYLENDKAMPSKDMVLWLGQALNLPYRQQNSLLLAAGFAPVFKERGLDSEQLGVVNQALQQLLNNHDPYPALVLNSRYDVLMHNTGYQAFLTAFLGEDSWHEPHNALDLFYATDGLRPHVKNWDLVAPLLLARVREEAISTQDGWLLDKVIALSETVHLNNPIIQADYGLPMLAMELELNGQSGRFFTTIATIGTPLDLTTQEIRLEMLYPADEATRQLCQAAL